MVTIGRNIVASNELAFQALQIEELLYDFTLAAWHMPHSDF